MKKLLSLAVLASTMALTACGGGDSSSSGSTYTTTTATSSTGTTTPTTSACTISGTNVYGKNGTTCTFNVPSYNNGATGHLVCSSTGSGSLVDGGSTITANGITIGTYKFACQ